VTKSIIIILFIILAVLIGGCSYSDASAQKELRDSILTGNDVKRNLSDIEETFTSFDYDKVIKDYSDIIPENSTITKFRYFVVFSDMNDSTTFRLIDNDIRNTIDAMEKTYVSKKPLKPTPMFLFKDFDTYKKFVLANFDIEENDISQYGFYKVSKDVIVIRYVSWKGSVPHEVTHKFTRIDFPEMPSWFDEGLASLNEKSTFKEGELVGDFSLRIIPLRRALKEETYTGLKKLMETNDTELYGKRSSFYYAQSRYLLMLLQKNGLLTGYYKLFRDTYPQDETGISQLEKVTGKTINNLDEELIGFINSFEDK
jgi:hypothetical protein